MDVITIMSLSLSIVAVVCVAAVAAVVARRGRGPERFAKGYREQVDELHRQFALTHIYCKNTGCIYIDANGKCSRRSIVVDDTARCMSMEYSNKTRE